MRRIHAAARYLGLALAAALAGCSASTGNGSLHSAAPYAGGSQMSVASVLTVDPSELATETADAGSDDGETLRAAATAAAGPSIRLTPIIGAPLRAVTPLSHHLARAAAENGVGLRGYEDAASDHVLKGYLAAETTDGETLVVFVWDVLDADGVRLHRIRGVEEVRATAAGWDGVPPELMERIARRTLADYVAWRGARSV